MTPAQIRDVLRKILIDADEAARIGGKVLDQVEKAAPAILTGTGTYLLSKLIGESLGFEARKGDKLRPSILPPVTINLASPELSYKTAGGSVGERIEPPSHWLSWQKDRAEQGALTLMKEREARNVLREVVRSK